MPLVPSRLSSLPPFEGHHGLYSDITPGPPRVLNIRIFTAWPNHDRSAPIEASLSIEDLLQPLQYNAISYYCGNANDLDTVIVHGSDKGLPHHSCEVPVTRSLTAALRQFRARAYTENTPLPLWTDALCVNQCDANESSADSFYAAQATELILRHAHLSLGALGYWVHPHPSSCLPSWVLEFTRCTDMLDENGDRRFLSTLQHDESDVSAGSNIRTEHRDMKSLHVAEFVLDGIQEVARSIDRRAWHTASWKRQLLLWLLTTVDHLNKDEASAKEFNAQLHSFLCTIGASRSYPDRIPLFEMFAHAPLKPQEIVLDASRLNETEKCVTDVMKAIKDRFEIG